MNLIKTKKERKIDIFSVKQKKILLAISNTTVLSSGISLLFKPKLSEKFPCLNHPYANKVLLGTLGVAGLTSLGLLYYLSKKQNKLPETNIKKEANIEE